MPNIIEVGDEMDKWIVAGTIDLGEADRLVKALVTDQLSSRIPKEDMDELLNQITYAHASAHTGVVSSNNGYERLYSNAPLSDEGETPEGHDWIGDCVVIGFRIPSWQAKMNHPASGSPKTTESSTVGDESATKSEPNIQSIVKELLDIHKNVNNGECGVCCEITFDDGWERDVCFLEHPCPTFEAVTRLAKYI